MGPSLTAWRITVLTLLVAGVLGSCVPVPGPASSAVVRRPTPPAEALTPHDRVLLLSTTSTRADDPTMVCIHDAIRGARRAVTLVPAVQVQDTPIPGIQVPFEGTFDDFRHVMGTPPAREALARLDVRYVVAVSAMRRSSGTDQGPGLGAAWATQESRISTNIWDFRHDVIVGTVEVVGSGTLRAVGITPGWRFMSVLSIPATDYAACRRLGHELANLLTGG